MKPYRKCGGSELNCWHGVHNVDSKYIAMLIAGISVVLLGGILYISTHSAPVDKGEYLPSIDEENGIEFEDQDIVEDNYTESIPDMEEEYVEFPDEI